MLGTLLITTQAFVVGIPHYGARWSSRVLASTTKLGTWARLPSLPTCERLLQDRGRRPYLEHVHHLPEIGSPKPGSLLHGKALEVLDDAETINLSFLIL